MVEPRVIAGRFRLDEPLGERPERWLARDLEHDEQAIVLTRVDTGTTDDEVTARTERAVAAIVAGLDSLLLAAPNAVVRGDEATGTGHVWVARADLDATPLRDLALDERALARVGSDVAGALSTAHGAGVVHGDVRADAILVRADGSGVLTGFATTAPRDVAADAPAPAHPEPERVPGRPAGPGADVFALGAVLRDQLDRAGVAASDRMTAALRTMRAEFADVRPTAWAAQQRLAAVANAAADTAVVGSGGVESGSRAEGSDPRGPAMAAAAQPFGGGTPAGQWSGPPVPPQATPSAPSPAPPSAVRSWLVVAAVVLAALAVVAALVLPVRPVAVAGTATPPAGTTPPPPSLLGDVARADPCSLLDIPALTAFGTAEYLAQIGDVASCTADVDVAPGSGGGIVYVTASLAAKALAPPEGTPSRDGELTIHRALESGRSCVHSVVLPDGMVVLLTIAASSDSTADVCRIADSATQTAVSVLRAGGVKTRDLDVPRTSLLSVRACDILDPTAVTSIPSLRNLRERGYNDWSCKYGADPSFPTGARIFVRYNSYASLDGGTATITIDGRSAATFPGTEGFDNCEIAVSQRSFTSSTGLPRIEVLSIYVYLATDQPAGSPDAACQKATELARSAAPRMPPTQ